MTGIYKITNRMNGKCYIGQSVDIKKRWVQHIGNTGRDSNPMYLDFKKFGIDNFDFEVLEECKREELNAKEIYYIKFFDSYRNGYNLTTGGQGQPIEVNTLAKAIKLFPQKLTSKHWLVYYYLIMLAYDIKNPNEEYWFLPRRELNISSTSKYLGMSRSTFYQIIKVLIKYNLIKQNKNGYMVYQTYYYKIDFKKFCVLLNYAYKDYKYIDMLRLYIIFKEAFKQKEEIGKITFSKKFLIRQLDHGESNASSYVYMENFLETLKSLGFIKIEEKKIYGSACISTKYKLLDVN